MLLSLFNQNQHFNGFVLDTQILFNGLIFKASFQNIVFTNKRLIPVSEKLF